MMSVNYTTIDSNQNISGSVPILQLTLPSNFKLIRSNNFHFWESNLQTFPPSVQQEKISSASGPPRHAHDSFSKPVSGTEENFTIAAYRPYFDVDTSDVLERIKDSLFPFRATFSEKTSENPDLYGPFWICTTLRFVAVAIGTFVTYVAQKLQHTEWQYDITLVTWSAGLFYGYAIIVPVLLYIILKYFSAPSGMAQLFCLYGYSLFIFIPALCLSVVPVEIFRWVITGVGGFIYATFVALNLRYHSVCWGKLLYYRGWYLWVAACSLIGLEVEFVYCHCMKTTILANGLQKRE